MHETGIEISPATGRRTAIALKVPKRIDPVRVICVCIQSEHLAEDQLAVVEECFRESSALADPIMACESWERGSERSRTHSDGSVCARSIEGGDRGVFGRSGAESVRREDTLFREFAD